MRRWGRAVAGPNRIAAHVFTTSPMNVSTLGLMRDSASQRTMVSSSTPQARPKALVQLREDPLRGDPLREVELRFGDDAIRRPPSRARPRRGSWSGLEFPAH